MLPVDAYHGPRYIGHLDRWLIPLRKYIPDSPLFVGSDFLHELLYFRLAAKVAEVPLEILNSFVMGQHVARAAGDLVHITTSTHDHFG